MAERLIHSSNRSPKFGICCLAGRISLPLLPEPPEILRTLLDSQDNRGKQFREHICQYNVSLAFTSLGVKLDHSVLGRGPYVFKIHGEVYHRHGSLLPIGEQPCYAQLYFYDPSEALGYRQNNNRNVLDNGTLGELQQMMLASNPFVDLYRQGLERLRDHPNSCNIEARLTYKPHTDIRHYNIPSGNEIAIILPGEGEGENSCDIVV